MIESIAIEDFRGIRSGTLSDLPRLAVLTGPNGCGKSSILEALEIGGAATPITEVVLARRSGLPSPRRWVVRNGSGGVARISLSGRDGQRVLEVSRQGENVQKYTGRLTAPCFVELWPGRIRVPLHQCYSEARLRLAIDSVVALLAEVDPSIKRLEILTEGDSPVLHVVYDDRVVPAALAGDGMEALIRLALELGRRPGGTFLIEEPEAHQHTAAIVRTARLIAAAARSGCQVIFSTHSMELLDAILASLQGDELDWLAVYRLRLVAGDLRVLRMAGRDVNEARTEIQDDLR